MTALATALWAGALAGVACVIAAVTRPARRRVALLLAAVLFLPIGVAGILSVGIVFIAAALACVIAAIASRPGPAATPPA